MRDTKLKLALIDKNQTKNSNMSTRHSPASSRSRACSDNPLSESFSEALSNDKVFDNSNPYQHRRDLSREKNKVDNAIITTPYPEKYKTVICRFWS